MKITRKERGIAGHYHGSGMCGFRRHTLVSYGDQHFIVSSVGLRFDLETDSYRGLESARSSHHYETKVWLTKPHDIYEHWADYEREVIIHGPSNNILDETWTAKGADEMHEEHIKFLSLYLQAGVELARSEYGSTLIFTDPRITHVD